MDYIWDYFNAFWLLLVDMSAYLLFGFLFAGILHIFMQKEKVGKALKGNNFRSVLNATLLGIPLPLCSCGVIPAGLSFHKNGASKGSTVSFLISTPQTGIDSILVTYSMLGLPFAIIRPFVALFTGLAGGVIANKLALASTVGSAPVGIKKEQDSSVYTKIKQVFYYGFIEFIQDISKWLVIGLLLAALLNVIIPDDFFTTYVNYPWLNMLLVLLVSVPLYICATGSVPIAAVLMMKGLSPGAALVFLMAGPATNIATVTVLYKSIGRAATNIYLATIIGGAILFGLVIDIFLPIAWFGMTSHEHHHHHQLLPEWLSVASAIVLSLLVINGYILKWVQQKKQRKQQIIIDNNMKFERFKVDGMTCKNCKAHVERDLMQIEGVEQVIADIESGHVIVTGQIIDTTLVQQAVENAGYLYKGKVQ